MHVLHSHLSATGVTRTYWIVIPYNPKIIDLGQSVFKFFAFVGFEALRGEGDIDIYLVRGNTRQVEFVLKSTALLYSTTMFPLCVTYINVNPKHFRAHTVHITTQGSVGVAFGNFLLQFEEITW